MSRRLSILVPLLVMAACVDSGDDLGTHEQSVIPCPKLWGCGENSPMMGPFTSHEYATDGTPNTEGVRIFGMKQGATWYQVRVIGGNRLAGYDPATSTWISGSQLANAYILLVTPTDLRKITIKKVSPLASSFTVFWVGPHTPIETYELTTNVYNGTDPVPLCNNPPERESGEGPGRLWARPFEAFVYSGDRYDAERMEVVATGYRATAPWFNVACAGSAIAKLHLTRHTTAGSLSTHQSTWQQRQAMLKMYVSDVNGTGFPFTKKGTALHWENVGGWSQFTGGEFAHESRWNENGALCLDTHRLFAEYRDEIDAESIAVSGDVLPPCDAVSAPPGSYYVSSAVPDAPAP